MKLERPFYIGLLTGIFLSLVLALFMRCSRTSQDVIVKWRGEKLTQSQLRQMTAADLVPLEDGKAKLFKRSLENWLKQKLFAYEAKAKKMNLEEFYREQIWSQVQVSPNDALAYYQKYQALFTQPFEKIQEPLFQKLRKQRFNRVEAAYLQSLIQKHKVKIRWEKIGVFGAAKPASEQNGKTFAPFKEMRLQEQNYPTRGNPNAPITIEEFVDFNCHFCRQADGVMNQLLAKYQDKVKLVFRHYPLSETPGAGSFVTHEAAACASDQNKFWEFHDVIFKQEQPVNETNLDSFAGQAGLDLQALHTCLAEGKHRQEVIKDKQEGTGRGVQGTPNFFINQTQVVGAFPLEHFEGIIEGILDPSKAKPVETAPAVIQGPVAFDDLEKRPSMGPKDAPVTLVEFSDFACPFCKKAADTIGELMKNYEGKIRLVFRDYPLAMHQGADRVHEAAACAHEQKKFWPYHDQLFQTLGESREDDKLIGLAKELGLNQRKFEKCLKENRYKESVQNEIAKGNQSGVQGTPSFFINGKAFSGALPYENFKQMVDEELAKAGK